MAEEKNAKNKSARYARTLSNLIVGVLCGSLIGFQFKSWPIAIVVFYFFVRFEVLVDAGAGTWHNTRGN